MSEITEIQKLSRMQNIRKKHEELRAEYESMYSEFNEEKTVPINCSVALTIAKNMGPPENSEEIKERREKEYKKEVIEKEIQEELRNKKGLIEEITKESTLII